MDTETTTCPACEGDGWGIEGDDFVIVQTEGSCLGCAGTGIIPLDRHRRVVNFVVGHYKRMGWA